MAFQDITVERLLELHEKGEAALIDVRSPSEFSDSTIPGSVNIPLFDDDERAEIGTLFKQVSVDAAKQRGLEIVSAKLPAFVRAIDAADAPRKAVFCWRGGMRSQTTATLASLMGIRMYRLNGGFRAYRRWVVETLERMEGETLPPLWVINGYTGTGKTELLIRLAEAGYPVLNLEQMAMHRGSIFGHIGLAPHNQKTFESLLVHALLRYKHAPFLLMEAESKRIGKAVMPDFLFRAKERGTVLLVELPLDRRVANIMRDYQPASHRDAFMSSFARIEKRLHTPIAAEVRAALADSRYEDAAALLLEHYYDPRYEHASGHYDSEVIPIKAADPDDAYRQIAAVLPDLRGQR